MTQKYLLKNGLVFDFEKGRFTRRDLLIGEGMAGRIAGRKPGREAVLCKTEIDITDRYVVPGMFDFHTHVGHGGVLPYDPEHYCPASGVTGVLDGGSYGTDQIGRFAEECVRGSRLEIHALLHIAREGQSDPSRLEDQRPECINADLLKDTWEKYPDLIRGFKIRLEQPMISDKYAAETVFRTGSLAEKLGGSCFLMLHLGQVTQAEKLQEILSLLRPGDVVTHIYQPKVAGFTEKGTPAYDALRKAQERGVLLDTGFGSRQWTFETLRNAERAGIVPDTISSDCNATNIILEPGVSMLYAAMVLNAAGMSWKDFFSRACVNNRNCLNLQNKGSLAGGRDRVSDRKDPYAAGDIMVFRFEETGFSLTDMTGETSRVSERIDPVMTFCKGHLVYDSNTYPD